MIFMHTNLTKFCIKLMIRDTDERSDATWNRNDMFYLSQLCNNFVVLRYMLYVIFIDLRETLRHPAIIRKMDLALPVLT